MRFRGGGIGHIYMRQIEQWLDATGWGTTWPSLGREDPNPDLASDNGNSLGCGMEDIGDDAEEEDEDEDDSVGEDDVEDEDGEDEEQPEDSDKDSDEEESQGDGRNHPSQPIEGEWDESEEEPSL